MGAHDAGMTTTARTLAPTDPRFVFALAVRTGTDVMAHVTPEVADRPTPCDDFAVRDVAAHLVHVLERVAALGRGDDPFGVPEVVAADGELAARWAEAAHRVQEVWSDDAVLDRPMSLPWNQGPGGQILLGYVSEVTVHTWDLATGLGCEPAWDDRPVQVALDGASGLPAEGRMAMFEAISKQMGFDEVQVPFKDAVPVAADAPLIDRLVAWNGRDPGWAA